MAFVYGGKSFFSRARACEVNLAQLEDTNTAALESSIDADTVVVSREFLDRLHNETKFNQARIAALNFEVARLKKWRFGYSSESLDTSTQAV
jgi:hypothetical protein